MTSYDPNVALEPREWQALGESETHALVDEHHRSSLCEHPPAPSPLSHAAIHVIVENQVAMGDEAPVAATVARLMAEGLNRHRAIHAVGSVLAAGLFNLLKGSGAEGEFSATYYAALGELTAEGWLQYGGDDELDFGDPDDELGDELQGILTAGEEDGVAVDEDDHEHECGDPHCGHEGVTVRRESPKIGRNDPCPCGSGKKYKKCCLPNESV